MKKGLKVLFGVFLVLCLVATTGVAMSPPTKHITVSIIATTNDTRTPVNVFVNGINLDDKIDELEQEFAVLVENFLNMKVTLADYIYLNELKHELLEAYDTKLIQMVQSNETNTTELMEVIRKQQMTRAQVDELTLRVIAGFTQPTQTYPSRGWIDIYGNHRDFNDPEYIINPEFDFRLIDCYSTIGKSAVLQDGTIKIVGVLYNGGVVSTREMEVILIDPESNQKPQLLISTEVGENKTDPYGKVEVHWITPTTFVLEINTKDMYPGLKQVDIEYSNYKVSCTFLVIKPYLYTQTIGNFTRIMTNYPALMVNNEVITPINGVAWVNGTNPEVVGIVN